MTSEAKSLMQIQAEGLEIQKAILMADGELTPELEAFLDDIEGQLEAKARGYAIVMKQLEAFEENQKAMAAAFRAKAKTAENIRQRMIDKIKLAMVTLDKKKIAGKDFGVTLAGFADKIEADVEKLPDQFIKRTVVETADMDAIKKALKEGTEIVGVEVFKNHSLRVTISGDLEHWLQARLP